MDRRTMLRGAASLAGLALAPDLSGLPTPTNRVALKLLGSIPLRSFAFGSCNQSTSSQAYWLQIAKDRPDLWIWLGDTVYADGDTMDQRIARYTRLKSDKYYSAFRSLQPVIGTWDDHDFRNNNKDGQWSDKELSKKAVVAFLDTDPAKVEGHSGIYQSYRFGPRSQCTKVILLDLRFNMVQQNGLQTTLLGGEQWEWLRAEVSRNDYELLVIGSSQNVLSPSGAQAWAAFPAERSELYAMLRDVVQPVLFLSGDRHHGDFSKLYLGDKPIYEFMSSGLTHYNPFGRSNPNRIGKSVRTRNYGLIQIGWETEIPELTLQLKSPSTGKVLQEVVL